MKVKLQVDPEALLKGKLNKTLMLSPTWGYFSMNERYEGLTGFTQLSLHPLQIGLVFRSSLSAHKKPFAESYSRTNRFFFT